MIEIVENWLVKEKKQAPNAVKTSILKSKYLIFKSLWASLTKKYSWEIKRIVMMKEKTLPRYPIHLILFSLKNARMTPTAMPTNFEIGMTSGVLTPAFEKRIENIFEPGKSTKDGVDNRREKYIENKSDHDDDVVLFPEDFSDDIRIALILPGYVGVHQEGVAEERGQSAYEDDQDRKEDPDLSAEFWKGEVADSDHGGSHEVNGSAVGADGFVVVAGFGDESFLHDLQIRLWNSQDLVEFGRS